MSKSKLPVLKKLAFSILGIVPFALTAQNPTGYIATWKNDADGAYSIIHDDYGDTGVDGIWQYADTICSNRNVKFTFGAIAERCEQNRSVNGYSSPYVYARDVMMAQHGHEIISHSHTHDCAVGTNWDPCDIAPNWGENPNSANFNTQLVTAHNSIVTGTGFAPVYYIFPYDRFTHAANDKLKELGYLGSRTGWSSPYVADAAFYRNGYENTDLSTFYPDADGFFRTAVEVFDDNDTGLDPADQTAELNSAVDNAINNSLWANRELHNVGWTGWGSVQVEPYRDHIDYVKSKVDNGQLYVGTVSELLTYQIQKLKYSSNVVYSASSGKVFVTWNSIGAQYNVNVETYLNALSIKTPITMVVDLDGLSGAWKVKQDGIDIDESLFYEYGGKLFINVYPHEGDLEIYKTGAQQNSPYVDNQVNNYTNLNIDFTSFEIDLKDVFEDVETSDNDLIYTATGYSGVTVDIVNGIATVSSSLGWTGTTSITFTAEDEGGLTVNEISNIEVKDLFSNQTPFGGIAISIPGRVEVEDFDEGGQGIAFNEVTNSWDPDPVSNPYRAGNPVDIDLITNTVEYGIGYTVTGEWLEYTIYVETTGWYDVTFNIAQINSGPAGRLKLSIDDADWLPATDMPISGAWATYMDFKYPTSLQLSKGKHLLRLNFEEGDVNVNYLDILQNPLMNSSDLEGLGYEVSPNPAASYVKIEGDFEMAFIYSQTGKLIKSSKEKIVDLTGLADGVYFVRIDDYSAMTKLVVVK